MPHRFLTILLILGNLSVVANARWNQDSPELRQFRASCHKHRQLLTLDWSPEVGSVGFFPLGAIESAQGRFSFLRAQETRARGRKSELALPIDEHRALFGLQKPGLGVLYRGKIYLTDGNHKALASLAEGASTMPVRIIGHFNDRATPIEFQERMELAGLGHWRDYRGQMMPMMDLCGLINDPNLMLARLGIRRVDMELKEGRVKILKTAGGQRVFAIKINHDVPFLEILIADTLQLAGESWDDGLTEEDLKPSDLSRHLEILRESIRQNPNSPLANVLFLNKPRLATDLNIEKLISHHLETHNCESYLLPEVN